MDTRVHKEFSEAGDQFSGMLQLKNREHNPRKLPVYVWVVTDGDRWQFEDNVFVAVRPCFIPIRLCTKSGKYVPAEKQEHLLINTAHYELIPQG